MKLKCILIKRICLVSAVILGALLFSACNSKSDDIQYIQLSSNSSYVVADDINEVVITGDPDGELLYGVRITINARENDLTLILDNANFKAKQDLTAILCKNASFKLTVRFKGQSTIIGGTGMDGSNGMSGKSASSKNWSGGDGHRGGYALRCGEVIFEAIEPESHLTLKGGRGGDGGDAGSRDTPMLLEDTVKPNGGNGGDGASALYCEKYTFDENDVEFIGGDMGWGGKAGYFRIYKGLISFVVDEVGRIYGSDGERGKRAQAVTRYIC